MPCVITHKNFSKELFRANMCTSGVHTICQCPVSGYITELAHILYAVVWLRTLETQSEYSESLLVTLEHQENDFHPLILPSMCCTPLGYY